MHDRPAPASLPKALRQSLPALLVYLAAAALSFVIVFWTLELWRADFKVLFTYASGKDLLVTAAYAKGLLEQGAYLTNLNLGAPYGLQSYDFPASQFVFYSFLRIFVLITRNYAVAINSFYIFTFPLTTVSALWVFRRFRVSTIPAVGCALLYTFLFSHFGRGLAHLMYSAYFLIPLVIFVVLSVGLDEDRPSGRLRELLSTRWFLLRLAVCMAVGADNIYHSYFAVFFLLSGGLFTFVASRDRLAGKLLGLLACGTVFSTSLNILPSLLFWAREGSNPGAVVRSAIGAELYGLKITNLMLPVLNHRVGFLAALTQRYYSQIGVNEAAYASLGMVGSLGFVFLLLRYLVRFGSEPQGRLLDLLGWLNWTTLLLATVGGFSSIAAFMGLVQLRSYNRISVFIGFLSLMAVALVWTKMEGAFSSRYKYVALCAALLFAAVGIREEIPLGVAPDYDESARQWAHDSEYVARLESSLPAGAMVFQLPYVPFPENPTVVDMPDYSHLRPYLHSRHTRWSYGAMKGREGARLLEATAALPVPQMANALASAGYAGIYVDRFAYTDRAAALELQLHDALHCEPVVSGNQRYSFFDLGAAVSADDRHAASLAELVLPFESKWEGGFSGVEKDAHSQWRWCSNSGTLRLSNRTRTPLRLRIGGTIRTGSPQDSKLRISSPLFSEELAVNAKGLPWSRNLTLPPGDTLVSFSSNAQRVNAPGDTRVLVFALYDFTLEREGAPSAGATATASIPRPVEVTWSSGASGQESGAVGVWHWCSSACTVELANPSDKPARVRLILGVRTGHEQMSTFTLQGPRISDRLALNSAEKQLSHVVTLPPGKQTLTMKCDAQKVDAPNDPRVLVFMVRNLSVSNVR